MKKTEVAILMMLAIFSCKKPTTENVSSNIVIDQAEEQVVPAAQKDLKASTIIAKAIEAHGGTRYDTADYTFVFRKNEYHFKNDGVAFTYQVSYTGDKGEDIKDVIVNGAFSRFVNNEEQTLSEKKIATYSGALNSVIYFATLPHKLKDAAVNKSYQGSLTIKEKDYYVIKIFFNEEGGGEDHEDNYFYWINKETNKIDYLAYNYAVNGGGTRFRSFYNRRNIGGITFQDYVNWGADKDASLAELPSLFEQGKLKEFSKIETEHVKQNN